MVGGFFLTLMAWLYISVRLGIERDASRKYDREKIIGDREDAKRKTEWVESVTDKELERKIREDIMNAEESSEIMKEIEWLLQDLPQFQYEDFHSVWLMRKYKGNMNLLLRIILANRGYIPYDDAVNSFGIYSDTNLFGFKRTDMDNQECMARLFLWIQEKLKDFDINYRPMFKTGNSEFVPICEDNTGINELIVWEPLIPYYGRVNEH